MKEVLFNSFVFGRTRTLDQLAKTAFKSGNAPRAQLEGRLVCNCLTSFCVAFHTEFLNNLA
jgi:hypothetical protein